MQVRLFVSNNFFAFDTCFHMEIIRYLCKKIDKTVKLDLSFCHMRKDNVPRRFTGQLICNHGGLPDRVSGDIRAVLQFVSHERITEHRGERIFLSFCISDYLVTEKYLLIIKFYCKILLFQDDE